MRPSGRIELSNDGTVTTPIEGGPGDRRPLVGSEADVPPQVHAEDAEDAGAPGATARAAAVPPATGETSPRCIASSSDMESAEIPSTYVSSEPSDRVTLTIFTEKIQGEGEDAEPLLVSSGGAVIVAVFDGLGGGGAQRYVRVDDSD